MSEQENKGIAEAAAKLVKGCHYCRAWRGMSTVWERAVRVLPRLAGTPAAITEALHGGKPG